jgi:glycosyltransferase involved in cell wall biosynthesis
MAHTNLVSHTDLVFDFSFIVPMRNNPGDLQRSLTSICNEAPDRSEVVVIDGSDIPLGEQAVRDMLTSSGVILVYSCDDRAGVFSAMNVGVLASRGKWLVMMPGGDFVNPGTRQVLESVLSTAADAVVFAQDMARPDCGRLYSFTPTKNSIWPHHSVVLRRAVHERFGLYPIHYKYSADQQFFAEIRNYIRFEMRPEVLTTFLLGGLSSSSTRQLSEELYQLRRKLGHSAFYSYFRSYITPQIRAWLERYSGYGGVATLIRTVLMSNYSSGKEAYPLINKKA